MANRVVDPPEFRVVSEKYPAIFEAKINELANSEGEYWMEEFAISMDGTLVAIMRRDLEDDDS